jgi:ABC-type sugar transport system ATPase subunit
MTPPSPATGASATNSRGGVGAGTSFGIRRVSKSYGPVRALKDVDLELRPGQVHALVGQNGSGKSTLVKLLSGMLLPDQGMVLRNGHPLKLTDIPASRAAGVATVFQELSILPSLSVAENILIGAYPRTPLGTISRRELERRAQDVVDRLRMDLSVSRSCRRLSLLELQLVEIARAMAANPELLILDEATSALDQPDAENLLRIAREMAEEGRAVLFVSHRMDEVFAVADRVSVLTDGQIVASGPVEETTREELLAQLAGKALNPLKRVARAESHVTPELLLEASLPEFAKGGGDLEVSIHRGEIVGMAGLQGHGQKEVMRMLAGDISKRGTTLRRKGKTVSRPTPARMVDRGVAYVPEDRNSEGLLLGHSIRTNSTLSSLDRVSRGGFLSRRREDAVCREVVERLSVKLNDPSDSIEGLSGGNQQKVLIGRSLEAQPEVLLLDDPTRGIDAGAKADIYLTLRELADNGVGVVLNSTELPELVALCDRVLVFHDHELYTTLEGDQIKEASLLAGMLGTEG